jgi:hypothetical protein
VKRHLISQGFTKTGLGRYGLSLERHGAIHHLLWNDANGRPLTIYGRYFKQHHQKKTKNHSTPWGKNQAITLYLIECLKPVTKKSFWSKVFWTQFCRKPKAIPVSVLMSRQAVQATK